jgi:muramoyltetrapeptide carboxypeptidase LdcA involved in peptidoglycan recycling
MQPLSYPVKLKPGSRVAIVSPSGGLPERFPAPYELGLRRLREDFELEPVEYPTTRRLGATPSERAADLHAAFADADIAAVIATIGGDDQVKVLRHLDPELLRANPKPFFGWSDNCNLLNYLFNLGIVGYHGGCVMTEYGRGGAMHPATAEALRAALFTNGEHELRPPAEYRDVDYAWDDPATFEREPPMEPSEGWEWHNADAVVEGIAWGGNLEILGWNLAVNRYVQPVEAYAGMVLFLETSEELPDATAVYRMLMWAGERGLLEQFAAVLVGRPKAWSFGQPLGEAARRKYVADQRAAVLRALDEYHPGVPTVFGVDIGHTDPNLVLPYGGRVRIDGSARRLFVTY